MSKSKKQSTYFRALFGEDLTPEEKERYNESMNRHNENMIRFQNRQRYDQEQTERVRTS